MTVSRSLFESMYSIASVKQSAILDVLVKLLPFRLLRNDTGLEIGKCVLTHKSLSINVYFT